MGKFSANLDTKTSGTRPLKAEKVSLLIRLRTESHSDEMTHKGLENLFPSRTSGCENDTLPRELVHCRDL